MFLLLCAWFNETVTCLKFQLTIILFFFSGRSPNDYQNLTITALAPVCSHAAPANHRFPDVANELSIIPHVQTVNQFPHSAWEFIQMHLQCPHSSWNFKCRRHLRIFSFFPACSSLIFSQRLLQHHSSPANPKFSYKFSVLSQRLQIFSFSTVPVNFQFPQNVCESCFSTEHANLQFQHSAYDHITALWIFNFLMYCKGLEWGVRQIAIDAEFIHSRPPHILCSRWPSFLVEYMRTWFFPAIQLRAPRLNAEYPNNTSASIPPFHPELKG